MNQDKRILVLFAHPSQRRSEVNLPMYRATKSVAGITLVDLYAEYPDYHIDVEVEQQRLLDHDIIVFMFPLYWYSTPAILKEWQDVVLEYGFAYGKDGVALQDKVLLCALSAGGKESAYRAEGYNHFPIRHLLSPLEQTAAITGMRYLPPYALFGSRTALEEGRIEHHITQWCQLLRALQKDQVDLAYASGLPQLSPYVDSLVREVP